MDWLNTGISPLKDLIAFLNKQSKTNNVLKKQLIMELRNNLNVFVNGFMNNTPYDNMIDLLVNDAIQEAVKNNFDFKKMKKGKIEQNQIFEDRSKKYIGWTAEKLMDKIDEKIVELKNTKKMNTGSVKDVKNNISLMMGNLYFRMKLLADFIKPGS
jgi:parvulin-like peptidyl-prolyl isomerase